MTTIPKQKKTPMWVPTINDQPRWYLGLWTTSRQARDAAAKDLDGLDWPGSTRVWVAVEKRK